MKRTPITLRFFGGRTATVVGEIAPVAPHLPQTFVIHRNHHLERGGESVVSEQSTGCRVVRGDFDDTKAVVLEAARQKLARVTPERMQQAMDRTRRQLADEGHGLSSAEGA